MTEHRITLEEVLAAAPKAESAAIGAGFARELNASNQMAKELFDALMYLHDKCQEKGFLVNHKAFAQASEVLVKYIPILD